MYSHNLKASLNLGGGFQEVLKVFKRLLNATFILIVLVQQACFSAKANVFLLNVFPRS
jgi:hypothetical protein